MTDLLAGPADVEVVRDDDPLEGLREVEFGYANLDALIAATARKTDRDRIWAKATPFV